MRSLLAALAALLCCPAVAAAAPFAELPFTPLAGDRAAVCLRAAGADRVVVTGTSPGRGAVAEPLRVAAGGAVVRESAMPLPESGGCPSAAVARSGAAVVAAGTCAPRSDAAPLARGRPARGAGELDAAGTASLALRPGYRLAGRRARTLRVTVHATAPGGRDENVARIDVRIRREPAR